MRYFIEFHNTIVSSRFKLMLAKLFGQRIVSHDSGCKVVIHRFRGKSYITHVEKEVARG